MVLARVGAGCHSVNRLGKVTLPRTVASAYRDEEIAGIGRVTILSRSTVPAGIGGVVGGWLLTQRSMERIARDNGVDVGDR